MERQQTPGMNGTANSSRNEQHHPLHAESGRRRQQAQSTNHSKKNKKVETESPRGCGVVCGDWCGACGVTPPFTPCGVGEVAPANAGCGEILRLGALVASSWVKTGFLPPVASALCIQATPSQLHPIGLCSSCLLCLFVPGCVGCVGCVGTALRCIAAALSPRSRFDSGEIQV